VDIHTPEYLLLWCILIGDVIKRVRLLSRRQNHSLPSEGLYVLLLACVDKAMCKENMFLSCFKAFSSLETTLTLSPTKLVGIDWTNPDHYFNVVVAILRKTERASVCRAGKGLVELGREQRWLQT
jgi:hypothetical protein